MAQFTMLDGATTIGGTKLLFEAGTSPDSTRLLFDFGLNYSTMGKYFEEFLKPRTSAGLADYLMTGLLPRKQFYRSDLAKLLQDTRPELAEQLKGKEPVHVAACFITHAHVDHTGSISFLDETIPLYTTPVTAAILRAVQDTERGTSAQDGVTDFILRPNTGTNEHGQRELLDLAFPKPRDPEKPTFPVVPSLPVEFPDCKVTAYPVDHSVPGACAYLIEHESGKLVYSGDLRFHGRMGQVTRDNIARLATVHPDALLIEGTNVDPEERPSMFVRRFKCLSEDQVGECALREVQSARGLVIADFGMKDLDRLMTFQDVAHETGRRLAILPRDAFIAQRAQDALYPTIDLQDRDLVLYVKRSGSGIYDAGDVDRSWARSTILQFAGWPSAAVDTAEWRKAVRDILKEGLCSRVVRASEVAAHPSEYILALGYWDIQELCDLQPPSGSLYIHSSAEAFNEEMSWSQERLARWLALSRMDSIHIHASGHASRDDLFNIVEQLAPRHVYPVHTEHAERYAEQFGDCVTLLANGRTVTLTH
jgi:ribonuclease J